MAVREDSVDSRITDLEQLDIQLYRTFFDYSAYAGDRDNGVDTVIAITLEKTPQGLIFGLVRMRAQGKGR